MNPPVVVSGEGVALDLPHAGIGSRLIATLVDLVLQVVTLLVLIVLDSALGGGDSAAVGALVIVELVLVLGGYPVLCEWLTRGRTVGKLWLGLRVVRDDGAPIGFRHALVRGLSSLVLEKPGLTGGTTAAAGLITAIFNERDKRIGDLLAGTFVLNERAGTSNRPVLHDWGMPPQLRPWAATLDLSRLDDQLALTLRQFVSRAPMMTVQAQYTLGEQLRSAVLAVIAPPPPAGAPTPHVLRAVLEERRRRSAPAAPTGWGPAPAEWAPGPAPGSAPAPTPPGGWSPAAAPPPTGTQTPPPEPGPFAPPS